ASESHERQPLERSTHFGKASKRALVRQRVVPEMNRAPVGSSREAAPGLVLLILRDVGQALGIDVQRARYFLCQLWCSGLESGRPVEAFRLEPWQVAQVRYVEKRGLPALRRARGEDRSPYGAADTGQIGSGLGAFGFLNGVSAKLCVKRLQCL